MIALFVDLIVKQGCREPFLEALEAQAAATLADEPGCLHFDICVDADDPLHFLLYEVYADEDALAAHRESAHFPVWRAAADTYVSRQRNTIATLLPASATDSVAV